METKKTADALTSILRILNGLQPDERQRALHTAYTFFDLQASASQTSRHLPNLEQLDLRQSPATPFSERKDISPKEFLLQKKPQGEAQRIACLAFYLTHYRETPHFRNSDLINLNTEAAQVRISNVPRAVLNAVASRYLAHAGFDKKQLSADGEQFVLALPDQAGAALVMSKGRIRKNSKPRTSTRTSNKQDRATVGKP